MGNYKFRVYGYGEMFDGDKIIAPSLPLNEVIKDSKRYKFMLSTSCYDKVNNEIYENDIVSFMDKELFEVIYHRDGFILVNLESREPLGYLHNYLQYIKVIGNIYEGIVREVSIKLK